MTSCDHLGILKFRSALEPGDRVKLVAGPFAGAFGSLQSLDASGRVRALLEIFNGKIVTSVNVADIVREA